MATIPITKRGAEKLKEELHRLKTIERPAVITAIAEARAQGDLSENADYDAAKDRQGFIEGRIQEIEGKLSVAQVIDPSAVDGGGKVVFGATVELEDEDTGDLVKYQIVGEDEADLKQGLINISSPIARALIGSPQVLLVDEPTSALDHARGSQIIELITRLARELQAATLVVSHDASTLHSVDASVRMIDGRLESRAPAGTGARP